MVLASVDLGRNGTLIGALKSVTTRDQQDRYRRLVERQQDVDRKAEHNASVLDHTNLFREGDEITGSSKR